MGFLAFLFYMDLVINAKAFFMSFISSSDSSLSTWRTGGRNLIEEKLKERLMFQRVEAALKLRLRIIGEWDEYLRLSKWEPALSFHHPSDFFPKGEIPSSNLHPISIAPKNRRPSLRRRLPSVVTCSRRCCPSAANCCHHARHMKCEISISVNGFICFICLTLYGLQKPTSLILNMIWNCMNRKMARLTLATRIRRQQQTTLVLTWWNVVLHVVVLLLLMIFKRHRDRPRLKHFSSNIDRYPILDKLIYESDTMSISQIKMSRRCFTKLCHMLEIFGGLKPSKNMNIDEQNRVIISRFRRSGETVSRHFARVCNAIIRLHNRLLKKPEPVPDNSTDQRCKWFKNCLEALDGTYIKCLVPIEEKPRYRTRKNDIATNILGVCSQDMQFIYVLTGWEGSATDGRVLRDALLRPHGLKVPRPGMLLLGKDRAQGIELEIFFEMEQEVNIEETQESDDDLLDSDNDHSHNTNLQNDETSPSVISRNRKSRSDDGFNNAVGLITESLKEISKDLSQGIKFDMKINELSEKIPSKIFKMTSLTQTEKFKALTKIRGDFVNIQNFWQMGEDHREAWVKYIVENE
ncbi:hypothetical protein OSB04_007030 [Centaurea solstitialis]|uniref:DDE Tnp4 domain-containing protein n=1 Tax=Centaurea solstitialis TaxID=347529 RepID=A0AA38TJ29_9ASTR|nr:hypothetical protein OSB04_007030 [Centaurea solstitialis]